MRKISTESVWSTTSLIFWTSPVGPITRSEASNSESSEAAEKLRAPVPDEGAPAADPPTAVDEIRRLRSSQNVSMSAIVSSRQAALCGTGTPTSCLLSSIQVESSPQSSPGAKRAARRCPCEYASAAGAPFRTAQTLSCERTMDVMRARTTALRVASEAYRARSDSSRRSPALPSSRKESVS